jgi:chlorobactene glucosyltransferase
MHYLKADMLSGYIGQDICSFGEIITVPLMFFLTGFVIPLVLNRFTKLTCFSVAIGQFIAIRRKVFNAIGGCETFKKKTSEDIYMSRYVKKMGFSTRFICLEEHVKCRMYNGYREAIEGIGKNIFDFLGKKTIVIFLIAVTVLFFLFFPFPLLIGCLITSSPWTLHIFVVNVLYTLTWIFMLMGQRIKWWYGFLWPLMFLNLLYIAWWSWFRTITGKGFFWKGRKVS